MDSKALAERYAGRHPSVLAALRWFDSDHLPPRLQAVAGPVAETAYALTDQLPDGPQLTIGLHKLIEAKDALVRAELDRTGERVIAKDAQPVVNATERPEDVVRRYAGYLNEIAQAVASRTLEASLMDHEAMIAAAVKMIRQYGELRLQMDAEEEAKAARAEADRTVIYGDTQAGRLLQARDQARAEGIPDDPEQLAERFHDMYESLAPHYGYRTREASRAPWDDVPARNGALMVAVCANLLGVDLPRWVGEIQAGLAGHEPGKIEPPTVALARETWPAAAVPAQLVREAENIEGAMRDAGFPMAVGAFTPRRNGKQSGAQPHPYPQEESVADPEGTNQGDLPPLPEKWSAPLSDVDRANQIGELAAQAHPDDRDPWAADRADGEAGEKEGHSGD